ncbi:type III-B CRISPR module RAMP protein Cmr4 [Spirosoma litoris]
MPAQTCDWYLLQCLTHLHAGRGDTNYDIVDKEVQRDPIENLPVIQASSLKGAFREWFKHQEGIDDTVVNTIFGNDSKRNGNQELKQGSHQFFEARLLALPVRSSHLPYFLATSKEVLIDCFDQLSLFGIPYTPAADLLTALKALAPQPDEPIALTPQTFAGDLYLDEYKAKSVVNETVRQALKTVLGYEHIALFDHTTLKEVAERLPVIARNNLENGRSVNLWYEEIVPRQSRFSLFVRHPDTETAFDQALSTANGRVQIGANATIGYGQCMLRRVITT